MHVNSYNSQTKDECGIEKYHTIIAFRVNTNTIQKLDETNKNSFCPVVNVEIFIYPFFLNKKKKAVAIIRKQELQEKGLEQENRRCPSSQSLLSRKQWANSPEFGWWRRPSKQVRKRRPFLSHCEESASVASSHDAQLLLVVSR